MDFHRLVVDALRLEANRQHKEAGELSDDMLLALHSVFGQALSHALDLIDRRKLTLICGPSGRRLFTVAGSKGQEYTCLLSEEYCTCPAFAHSVLAKNDNGMCKHLLACFILSAMEKTVDYYVGEEEFAVLLARATGEDNGKQ